MATFQFSEHQAVELDFCGELKFSLPLDDDTQDKLKKASKYLQDKSKGTGIQSLSELCDCVMYAIDDVLGEGVADQIAALKPDFGFWDAPGSTTRQRGSWLSGSRASGPRRFRPTGLSAGRRQRLNLRSFIRHEPDNHIPAQDGRGGRAAMPYQHGLPGQHPV